MEIDDLKSDWNAVKPVLKTDEMQLSLLQENKHPVLKSIRKQIVMEVLIWFLFLVAYYSMFDGATKPFWVNLILVISLILPIAHGLYGYYYNKYLTDGSDIKTALERLYIRLKHYALIAIIARVGFICGLLLFFSYNIDFTTTKYILLAFILLVFLIQLLALCQIWMKRLRVLKSVIITFLDLQ